METKICSKCNVEKSISKFSASKFYRDGFRGQCKSCRAAYTNSYKIRTGYKSKRYKYAYNPVKNRIALRRLRYGLNSDEYEQLKLMQGNSCALCSRPKKLVVDHCHDTKRVRGLLCNRCNVGLGWFGDNIAGLRRALQYVEGTLFNCGVVNSDNSDSPQQN